MVTTRAYVRCSHVDRAATGLSIESQRDAITRYAKTADLGDPVFYEDAAESAWKKRLRERPQGFDLVRDLRTDDIVIFYAIDRGFRSVYDFSKTMAAWTKKGIRVHLVSEGFNPDSANGKLLANIMASFAQWKSDVLSERSRESARKRRIQRKREVKEKWVSSGIDLSPEEIFTARPVGRAYSYGRVSHHDSTLGQSLPAQEDIANRYIENMLGTRRFMHFEDREISALNVPFRDRPSGGELDSILKNGDVVVLSRMDRGWRNLGDMLSTVQDWRDRGVEVHFADTMLSTSSAAGDLFLKIMAMLAEWEARFTSERTRMAMRSLKRQGRPVNQQTPMGFSKRQIQNTKHLALDKDQIRVMWWVYHMRENHKATWNQISDTIERYMAHEEGRDMIPRNGKPGRPKKPPTPRQIKLKVRMVLREWGAERCRIAYRNWPKISQIVQEVVHPQSLAATP